MVDRVLFLTFEKNATNLVGRSWPKKARVLSWTIYNKHATTSVDVKKEFAMIL